MGKEVQRILKQEKLLNLSHSEKNKTIVKYTIINNKILFCFVFKPNNTCVGNNTCGQKCGKQACLYIAGGKANCYHHKMAVWQFLSELQTHVHTSSNSSCRNSSHTYAQRFAQHPLLRQSCESLNAMVLGAESIWVRGMPTERSVRQSLQEGEACARSWYVEGQAEGKPRPVHRHTQTVCKGRLPAAKAPLKRGRTAGSLGGRALPFHGDPPQPPHHFYHEQVFPQHKLIFKTTFD